MTNASAEEGLPHFLRDVPVRRYRLTVAYDGADFFGWQKQEPKGQEPMRTVQGVLEATLIRVMRQPLNLVGASRTDSGVHAEGQTAHFDAASPIPLERMAHAINSKLPGDVEVRSVTETRPDFDAISDAIRKRYRYRLHRLASRPLGTRKLVWHYWEPLELQHMNDAATRLVGTHDIEGLSSAGHGRESTVRTIFACRVEDHGDELHVVIEGDGFLYNTVRIAVGTLIEVGRRRFEPARIDEILATADRRLAGPTAPASGLWLERIWYPDDES
ncbi:tRNA pseudouridine(38-40) synthase TruA [Mucisphaera calidilacus]|uniref:tRNA pseudouridine synthase A n=1 Tax=Mucisphaera calidilacus TaxID=2527982 RepID=A0A518BW82_9BACT|nr:tRNA pseudouridine(38-40) synthase TruA [Mucisphaera calidilacus]QDU71236.1 tRNA pseudouridine synthase A [Mucisphaera calidilacus]